MYTLSAGCQWRAVPKDLPPRSALLDYLDLWSLDGTLDRMHHALYVECRKTDVSDAVWIADPLAHGSIRSSFVPQEEIQDLLELPRTRKQLTRQ